MTVPIGVVLAGLGIAMMVMANRPPRSPGVAGFEVNPLVSAPARHPVTAQMVETTGRMARKRAFPLDALDTTGKRVRLVDLLDRGPVLVVFVMEGCPCSIEAQPYFARLANAFRGKIQFVEVTTGSPDEAKEWAVHFTCDYPVISDPKKRIVKAMHATNSAWSILIDRDGSIVKSWPGYSQSLLGDMATALYAAARTPPGSLDFSDAPRAQSAGCAF